MWVWREQAGREVGQIERHDRLSATGDRGCEDVPVVEVGKLQL